MKFKTLRSCAVFVIVGLLVCVSSAAAGAPERSVQFRLLAWGSYDVNLQFQSGKKPSEVLAFPTSFSPVYEFKGEGSLILFKMVEHEGKPQRQTACTVVIPVEMKQGLVILVPGDDGKIVDRKVMPNSQGIVSQGSPLVYDYVVIDDSPAAHPSGTIEFRNFSKLPIAINIAQRQLMLAPHDKAQVPLIAGAKRMPFRAAAQLGGGQWRLLGSNPLPISGADRLLVILRDGPANATRPGEANITIVPLFDWPPPPKPADDISAPPLAFSR